MAPKIVNFGGGQISAPNLRGVNQSMRNVSELMNQAQRQDQLAIDNARKDEQLQIDRQYKADQMAINKAVNQRAEDTRIREDGTRAAISDFSKNYQNEQPYQSALDKRVGRISDTLGTRLPGAGSDTGAVTTKQADELTRLYSEVRPDIEDFNSSDAVNQLIQQGVPVAKAQSTVEAITKGMGSRATRTAAEQSRVDAAIKADKALTDRNLDIEKLLVQQGKSNSKKGSGFKSINTVNSTDYLKGMGFDDTNWAFKDEVTKAENWIDDVKKSAKGLTGNQLDEVIKAGIMSGRRNDGSGKYSFSKENADAVVASYVPSSGSGGNSKVTRDELYSTLLPKQVGIDQTAIDLPQNFRDFLSTLTPTQQAIEVEKVKQQGGLTAPIEGVNDTAQQEAAENLLLNEEIAANQSNPTFDPRSVIPDITGRGTVNESGRPLIGEADVELAARNQLNTDRGQALKNSIVRTSREDGNILDPESPLGKMLNPRAPVPDVTNPAQMEQVFEQAAADNVPEYQRYLELANGNKELAKQLFIADARRQTTAQERLRGLNLDTRPQLSNR